MQGGCAAAAPACHGAKGESAAPRQAVLRPDHAPGVPRAVLPRVLEPGPQAPHRARGHAHRPGDPGAGRAVLCILAHDPPDLGRAWLERSPPARVPLKAPPDAAAPAAAAAPAWDAGAVLPHAIVSTAE